MVMLVFYWFERKIKTKKLKQVSNNKKAKKKIKNRKIIKNKKVMVNRKAIRDNSLMKRN